MPNKSTKVIIRTIYYLNIFPKNDQGRESLKLFIFDLDH